MMKPKKVIIDVRERSKLILILLFAFASFFVSAQQEQQSTGSKRTSGGKQIDTIILIHPVNDSLHKPLFALKTNLLFDASSAINTEIEVPLGSHWSLAGEWIFPWWLQVDKQRALQLGLGTLEMRRWLGNREHRLPMTGWFAGLHAGAGYYDLEWENKGYQGELFHAGLSAGYAHTISRNGNWRMEYSLGMGYMQTRYHEYIPRFGSDDEWHLIRQRSGNFIWVGPARAKVSLVFMLNHKRKFK